MSLQIRKMKEQDLGPAMELLELWNMRPRSGDPAAERSGILIANSFIAEADGRIVGVASYIVHSPEVAETASLAVAPDYRGRGLGHRLQQARIEEMRSRGICRVRSEADRPQTIEWYVTRFRYRVVGSNPKKHDFSLRDVDHWTVLELDLAAVDREEGRAARERQLAGSTQ